MAAAVAMAAAASCGRHSSASLSAQRLRSSVWLSQPRGLPALRPRKSHCNGGARLLGSRMQRKPVAMVAVPPAVPLHEEFEDRRNSMLDAQNPSQEPEGFDPGAAPPFGLTDLRKAIPEACWQKNTTKSMLYLFRDVVTVGALAAAAAYINSRWVWPAYWVAQGTMFWALFVVGHDCGHGSFSNNKALNNFVGHLTHSCILVPFHGWRISHRTHHANHGHVENDESWTPIAKSQYQNMDAWAKAGRLALPWSLFVYPFYLFVGSVEQAGSHFDPNYKLFAKNERNDVVDSRNWVIGMGVILAALAFLEGPAMLFKTYIVPYWINVMWLDAVTYLHHHGPEDNTPRVPWYRGKEWSYLRGGLSTIDRDYGLFNNIHHDIGTHVVHHIFPQIPHYNLNDATKGAKTVMGEYYREPKPSSGPLPLHLLQPLVRSFSEDHYVDDHGDVVYYKKDPDFNIMQRATVD